jgi:HAD superfamily hydrolase (TIGR01450 family)
VRLDDVRGFVFDVDGSLVHRGPDFRAEPLPGAVEVLERIRASGRPLVLFTNGSHMAPAAFAAGLREAGLPVGDDEVLTPVCSAISYLRRRFPGRPAMVFGSEPVRERMAAEGVPLVDTDAAEVVFVAHLDQVDMDAMEAAARAVLGGARLLTANYLPAYAGANGPIFSRGAMITAAIAKASSARPTVVGKPSRAAVHALRDHLGVPSAELLVTGDDVRMDIGLGLLGGARTVLVRTGITGTTDLSRLPEHRRPHAVIDGVGDLLQWL